MKKFYIPTSTLNFNNILSSESISPKAFYAKRDFGYSRWETIPENPFQNAIVLYDSLCCFERPTSDMEDHPLLIEIELDETKLKQANGILYSDHTIYLAPTTTNFFFFTEQDELVTRSMSENSLETKMLLLYQNKCIRTIEKPLATYQSILSEEPCTLNEQEIENDIRLNKMKGMLYGYYIGALLSTNLKSVKYLNVLREIHNIFAAILSSFDKMPTTYQNQRLDELFDSLNENNPFLIELNGIINNQTIVKQICELFQTKCYARIPDFESKKYYLYDLQSETMGEVENRSMRWIKNKIEFAKQQMLSKSNCLQPDKGELIVLDKIVSSLKNENVTIDIENKLCLAWFNETFSANTNGKISTYREEFAKNVTLKAKDVFQDDWENSGVRTYLNDLRRHISGDDFSHQWDNGLLSSIAAVILAGEDWEKLLSFMQTKEMTDYRIAFAFYGELNGFANLTRDFTDILYKQDREYIWNVYKEFHGQLHGEALPAQKIDEVPEAPKKPETFKEMSYNDVPLILIPVFECDDFQKLLPQAKDFYRSEAIKVFLSNQNNPKDLTKQLESLAEICPISKTKTVWKNCVKLIKPSTKKSGKKQEGNASLFEGAPDDFLIEKYFYCDKNVWYHIEPLIRDELAKSKIRDDLSWFQKNIMIPKERRQYYKDLDEKNNIDVIDAFCRMKSGVDTRGELKAPYLTDDLRNLIKSKLKDLYCKQEKDYI